MLAYLEQIVNARHWDNSRPAIDVPPRSIGLLGLDPNCGWLREASIHWTDVSWFKTGWH